MNLIRNGGFEDATMLHWTGETAGILSVSDVAPHRGSHCGLLTSSGLASEYITSDEYIEVIPYELISLSAWGKSADGRICRMKVEEYDEDLNLILLEQADFITGTAAYQQFTGEYMIGGETSYIALRLEVSNSLADELIYFDDVVVRRFDPSREVYIPVSLASIPAAVASGSTMSERESLRGYNSYLVDLYVLVATGTNPTLDVSIYEYSPDLQPTLLGSFAQAVGAANERIALPLATGYRMYVVYTIGGTTPSFNFKVSVTGKR